MYVTFFFCNGSKLKKHNYHFKILYIGPKFILKDLHFESKEQIYLRVNNDYFKNYERKKEKQSVLDEIKETEKYGFQTIKERLPVWIKQSKNAIKDEQSSFKKH